MELKFFKKKESPLLVLDIGTEAVKSLIIKKKGGKADILGSWAAYFQESGVFNNGFNCQEFEAEIFSIDEYENLYAFKFGSCLNDPWTLATYNAYKNVFKKINHIGFGSKR